MKLSNNPFKIILSLLLFCTAFSVDAQLRSKAKALSGGPSEICNYNYFVDITFWEAGEPPCDLQIRVALANPSSTPIIYFFDIDTDIDETDIDPEEGYTESFYLNIPLDAIEQEFCADKDGTTDITFVFNLFCLDDEGNSTAVDPCSEEFSSYFNYSGDNCNMTLSATTPLCCDGYMLPNPLDPGHTAITGDDGNDDDDDDEEEEDDEYGYIMGAENNIAVSESLIFDSSITQNSIDKSKSLASFEILNNNIEIQTIPDINLKYRITNVSGQVVIQGNINDDINLIDISNLNHGIYIITFGIKDKIESKIFVR